MSKARPKESETSPAVLGRLRTLIESFRASSQYFKWRTAVVAGWVIASAFSVALAMSGVERNPIDAMVGVRTVLGTHVVFVQNNSSQPWQNVTIELPGGWIYEQRTMRPQERVLPPVTEFYRGDKDNRELSKDFFPAQVTVSTSGGIYVWDASRSR